MKNQSRYCSLLLVLLFSFLCLYNTPLCCADTIPATEQVSEEDASPQGNALEGVPNVLTKIAVLALLSLAPYMVMLLTSFLKMVVVLSLLRNALGVQQSPPNPAIIGIALLMSIYVMFPTALAMYNAAGSYVKDAAPKDLISGETAYYLIKVIDKAKEPLKEFLMRNSIPKHQRYFYQLASRSFPPEFSAGLKGDDMIVIIPAYISSQLKSAFEIGVLIYLPFFVIDLVTSNILLAMGMMMLSPLTIALPLKLLLIVMIDGWTLVIQGLVLSYR
jgi:type III secretion protein R